MSSTELEDIGLTRSQIESAVRGERRSNAQVNLERSSTFRPATGRGDLQCPITHTDRYWAPGRHSPVGTLAPATEPGELAAGVPTAGHTAEGVRPAVGINEPIGIPSHLSLPPLDVRH